MMDVDYYRDQAARARRLAGGLFGHDDLKRQLLEMARDFDDIAVDLEAGAIEVRHPERLPQLRR